MDSAAGRPRGDNGEPSADAASPLLAGMPSARASGWRRRPGLPLLATLAGTVALSLRHAPAIDQHVASLSRRHHSGDADAATSAPVAAPTAGLVPALAPTIGLDTAVASCASPEAAAVLDGTDVVAYFEQSAWEAGLPNITLMWENYTWAFSNPARRDIFMRAPKTYDPQWGGFCAFGISTELTWSRDNLGPPANPSIFAVLDGKLYLFANCLARAMFLVNATRSIENGNTRWRHWFKGHQFARNTLCIEASSVACDPSIAPSAPSTGAPAPVPTLEPTTRPSSAHPTVRPTASPEPAPSLAPSAVPATAAATPAPSALQATKVRPPQPGFPTPAPSSASLSFSYSYALV